MQSLHLKLEAQAEYEEQYLTCRFWNKGTFSSSLNPNSSFVLEVFKKPVQKIPDTFCSGTRTIQGNAMK